MPQPLADKVARPRIRRGGRLRHASTFIAALLLLTSVAMPGATAGTRATPASTGHSASRPPAVHPATPQPGLPNLGPNVYVFTPGVPQAEIQATVDSIAAQQVPDQFGTQRYALLFEPGTYGSAADPLVFQVGYYTEVAGLGSLAGRRTINGSIDVVQPVRFGAAQLHRAGQLLALAVQPDHQRHRSVGGCQSQHRVLGGVAGRADAAGRSQRQAHR